MKKLYIFLLLLFSANTLVKAEYAEHALIVHRLSYWAPEYLTVTNNWNNMYFSQAPSTLKSLSVIKEINGQSTKDMEPENFYAIIDRATSFDITYMSKIRGENKTYTCQLSPKKGKMLYANNTGITYHERDGYISCDWPDKSEEKWFYTYRDEEKYIEHLSYGNFERTRRIGPTPIESTTIMSDQHADFFQFNSFDYMVAGDDYMTDLGLVQNFAKELEKKGLKYNPENPDIYLYLTKDSHSNIESIYVPNLISTTRSSSRTSGGMSVFYGNYSAWSNSNSRTTGSSTTNTQDMGQTKSIVDAELYLQFSILDAKKMDSPNPPVVWQIIHNRHFTNQINIIEWAKQLHVAVNSYPTPIKNIGRQIQTWGIMFKDKLSKTGLVCDVVDGGYADNNNIKSGCILKKITDKWYGKKSTFIPGKGSDFKILYSSLSHSFDKLVFNNRSIGRPYKEELMYQYLYIPETEIE